MKEARGNPGRRPIGAAPALSDDALASAPEWLGKDAREIWARLAPDLVQMRLLSRPDGLTFARYCELFGQWLTATRALQDGELVVTTTSEHVTMDRLNKYLQAQLLIEKRLLDLEDRFGLNPANRQRIFVLRAAGAGGQANQLPLAGEAQQGEPREQAPPQGPVGLLN